jgi:hypothetical protein
MRRARAPSHVAIDEDEAALRGREIQHLLQSGPDRACRSAAVLFRTNAQASVLALRTQSGENNSRAGPIIYSRNRGSETCGLSSPRALSEMGQPRARCNAPPRRFERLNRHPQTTAPVSTCALGAAVAVSAPRLKTYSRCSALTADATPMSAAEALGMPRAHRVLRLARKSKDWLQLHHVEELQSVLKVQHPIYAPG